MKKLLIAAILAFSGLCAHAKVVTMQVTIGAGVTSILPAGNITCRWIVFQNNAANTMRIGDSSITSSRGVKLLAGGSFYQGYSGPAAFSLSGWYVQGTQNDVIDVIYEDGQ